MLRVEDRFADLCDATEPVIDNNPAEDDDALYVLTQAGREYLARLRAQQWLFGVSA